MGTRAVLSIISSNYDATLATDQISVQLTEKAPGESAAVIDDGGTLFSKMEGKAEPGMPYTYTVGVRNNGGAPEYVRVIVRKYWTKGDGPKDRTLSPDLIQLKVGGEWLSKKISEETTVYYLKNPLSNSGQKDATLFSFFRIDDSIASIRNTSYDETVYEDGTKKTVVTYDYPYNGYTFHVEAEAQSVQTHNAAQAIKSVWGVDATVSGGTITAVK
jgi:hypothetical protein